MRTLFCETDNLTILLVYMEIDVYFIMEHPREQQYLLVVYEGRRIILADYWCFFCLYFIVE